MTNQPLPKREPTPELKRRFERAIAYKKAFEREHPDVIIEPDFWSPAFSDENDPEFKPDAEEESE